MYYFLPRVIPRDKVCFGSDYYIPNSLFLNNQAEAHIGDGGDHDVETTYTKVLRSMYIFHRIIRVLESHSVRPTDRSNFFSGVGDGSNNQIAEIEEATSKPLGYCCLCPLGQDQLASSYLKIITNGAAAE